MSRGLDSRNECDTPPKHIHARSTGRRDDWGKPLRILFRVVVDSRAFRDDTLLSFVGGGKRVRDDKCCFTWNRLLGRMKKWKNGRAINVCFTWNILFGRDRRAENVVSRETT